MTAPLRLVRVVWEDASIVDEGTWAHRDGAPEPEPVIFDQVGWLLDLTSSHVVLSSCIGKDLMEPRNRIPAGMVRSMTEFVLAAGAPIAIPKKRRTKTA